MKNAPMHQGPWPSSKIKRIEGNDAKLPKEVDVLVVGGGIAGVTAALLLAEAGRKVALIETRDALAGGDSAKTTAHITAILDASYATLLKNFGKSGARLIADGHKAALSQIQSLVTKLEIACDYKQVPAHLYAASRADEDDLDHELEALSEVGIDAERITQVGLPFETGRGIRVREQAQFDPVTYIDALAVRFTELGGTIHLGVRYKSAEPTAEDRRKVQTSEGPVVASDVVLATHAAPNKMVLQTKMAPMLTYCVAFRSSDKLPEGHFYSSEDPYHYLRTHHGAAGTLIIAGGHDHRVGEREDTETPMADLEAWIRERFAVDSVVCRWSGMVFESNDGAPYLGQNPGDEHAYVITGLSGNGMASGTLGAMVCADAIVGQKKPWAEVLRPDRIKPLAQGVEFVKHNAEVTKHMVGDRLKTWLSEKPLDAQQGAVMRHEGHAAAVFNDGTHLHVLSPVCPHAGCYVKYNSGEKTFDCPCHGSRFAYDGTLLAGPAVSDLPKLS